jgi:hypothetical protein
VRHHAPQQSRAFARERDETAIVGWNTQPHEARCPFWRTWPKRSLAPSGLDREPGRVTAAGLPVAAHAERVAFYTCSCRPGPGGGGASTLEGHPSAIFRRAVDRANLVIAEATAKELPPLNLTDAPELTMLIAPKDPRRHPRVAARAAALPRGVRRRDNRRSCDGCGLPRGPRRRSPPGRGADASGHG